MRRHRAAARPIALVVALVVAGSLSACRPARVGAPCRTTELGDDGAHWVLQCRGGRWVRAVTKRDVALAVAAARSGDSQPSGPAPSLASATLAPPPNDDYPAVWRNAPKDSVFDTWGYPNRECTSFVAWRLGRIDGLLLPVRPGDAATWDDQYAPYYRIDNRPTVGSIAQWNANEVGGGLGAGPYGHVAWVQAVYPDGSVMVEQYNIGDDGHYAQMHTRAPRYIHVLDS